MGEGEQSKIEGRSEDSGAKLAAELETRGPEPVVAPVQARPEATVDSGASVAAARAEVEHAADTTGEEDDVDDDELGIMGEPVALQQPVVPRPVEGNVEDHFPPRSRVGRAWDTIRDVLSGR